MPFNFNENMRDIRSLNMHNKLKMEDFYKHYSMFVSPNYVESIEDTIWKGSEVPGGINLELIDKNGAIMTRLLLEPGDITDFIIHHQGMEDDITKTQKHFADFIDVLDENRIDYEIKR